MRILTFTRGTDPSHRLGVLTTGDAILDLSEWARSVPRPVPFDTSDTLSLIAAGPSVWDEIVRAARSAGPTVAREEVRVVAPIPRPRKNVVCVGWNYRAHFAEAQALHNRGQDFPAHPTFFTKAPTSVIGPEDPIPLDPAVSNQLDWEAELAVVIGRRGKNIPEAEAAQYVFGYMVANDLSARDLQRQYGGQYFKGKSLDGCCPCGPWITTADEVDPHALRIMSRVNGTTKQESTTALLYFSVSRLIASLSAGMTLEPGDIIMTGTPPGVGFGRTPPEFLKAGDLLETEIEHLGVLRNPVGECV